MKCFVAAVTAAASCALAAPAPAQDSAASGAPLTLDQAVVAAGGAAPAADAATAALAAAQAARDVAALRPNPQFQAQVENIAGSGAYAGLRSAETTVGVSIPIELGGKRGARVAAADAALARTRLHRAIADADIRQQVTALFVEAAAATRRAAIAGDQARIAGDAARAAQARVQAGRASPLEQQRAEVVRLDAEAQVERSRRLAQTAAQNLSRRIGRDATVLDPRWLDTVPPATAGPPLPAAVEGTLALAAADADLAVADAGVRLARSQRVPDLAISPALRRLSQTGDTAAVISLSLPIPVFDTGRRAVAQATAERTRVEAQRRATRLDVEQAIADAQAEADNAAVTARTASGPALAAAQEAARIARIGYREGKFAQLELLDAERTLADTRLAAIDALAAYRLARARLERLTAPAPALQGN
ncbi:TolC family protein [Sphingomonas adhaesiva]|uniref:TolC family protein n=1 Tax=Sphingomonas adhaesiva TaxID=28212 RepID=UPI002FFA2898